MYACYDALHPSKWQDLDLLGTQVC